MRPLPDCTRKPTLIGGGTESHAAVGTKINELNQDEKMNRTKKLLAVLIPVLSCVCADLAAPASSWAACSGSSPRWTSTADYTSLNTCITGANAGDTITVSGNATWNTGQMVTFTRGVTLVGSGNPTITGKTLFLLWNANAAARAAHDTLTIRGFTFDGDNSTAAQVLSGGLLTLKNTQSTDYVTVVIRGNIFKNTQARAVYIGGRVYGVVSNNVIDRVYQPISAYGNDQNSWANETQAYGVAQNLYFEDNTIQCSTACSNSRAISGGQGGRIVVRYNTFDFANQTSSSQMWELHGLQSMQSDSGDPQCAYTGHDLCNPLLRVAEQYSTMVSEFYGNQAINWVAGNQWMAQRGGWMLFFNNYYAARTGSSSGIKYMETACDSSQKYYDTMGPYVQHIANTYVWTNYDKTTLTRMTKDVDTCADRSIGSPYTITKDRDYFTDPIGPFDGTSGVGCGTLAARPATCTTGVGYWATSQSCSDLIEMVGAKPTMPISGTLYKCTAPDTWTAYYSPYQYPHPLTAPSAPRNLVIK